MSRSGSGLRTSILRSERGIVKLGKPRALADVAVGLPTRGVVLSASGSGCGKSTLACCLSETELVLSPEHQNAELDHFVFVRYTPAQQTAEALSSARQ